MGVASQQELDTLARDNEQLIKEKQELLGRLQNGGIGAVDHAIEVSQVVALTVCHIVQWYIHHTVVSHRINIIKILCRKLFLLL